MLVAAVQASCAASGPSAERITLREYRVDRAPLVFELVSKSSGDELEYFSTTRTDAPRKFVDDELMAALSDHLLKHGCSKYGQAGPAPKRGDAQGLLRSSFEWQAGAEVKHWPIAAPLRGVLPPGLIEERTQFKGCQQVFLELYNATAAYQAIENTRGNDLFEEEQRRLARERAANAAGRN
ncbi:MAG: hypothetical protein WD226_09980 [Planctomycetota bacterium]